MPRHIALHLKPAAERALKRGHPWLYDQGIRQQNRDGTPGELAIIYDRKDRFLAIGLYDPHSPIRVKILQHHQPITVNAAFFDQRLREAIARREAILPPETDGYRLVHGENDALPALIVDRYAQALVLKLYSAAWLPHLDALVSTLRAAFPQASLYLRLSRQLQAITDHHDGQHLAGPARAMPIAFRENGLHFAADIRSGHKTGFFFDQRANRQRLRELIAAELDGAHVLDAFAYSGGFSVYAAAGGAASVLSLDQSAPALEAARDNMRRNGFADRHQTLTGDAFAMLHQLADEGRQFDALIVDPPSFAPRQRDVAAARHAYASLARLSLNLLRPGGLWLMASCSAHISADDFFTTITQTAHERQRPLREIARTSHAADHPIAFPEGAYLKALFAHA